MESHIILKEKNLAGDYKIEDNEGRISSKIWQIFGKIEKESRIYVENFVNCKHCKNIYKFTGWSTLNLLKLKCYFLQQRISNENENE